MGLSIKVGASSVGSDTNGATLFRVSGRAGLAFLSIRIRTRGGADLVDVAIELGVDGREEIEAVTNVVVMAGGALEVFEDKGTSDGRRDEVGTRGGR